MIDSATRRLDELGTDSLARVITWLDGLVDGNAETAEAEIKAMRALAGSFQTIDAAGRDRVVRFLNDHYAAEQPAEDGPNPL